MSIENTNNDFKDLGEPVVLIEVENEFEADILISKLKCADIPSFKKHSELGAIAKVYWGQSNFSISVMVPSSLLDQAKEIIEGSGETEYDFSEAENYPAPSEKSEIPLQGALTVLFFIVLILFVLSKTF